MCLFERWVYLKCISTAEHPHEIVYPIAPCAVRRTCQIPPSTDTTCEIKTVRLNRHCPACFESLRNTIGGEGDMCWPLTWGTSLEPEWCLDARLTIDWDDVLTDGNDGVMGKLDQVKGREDQKFRTARRTWKGWHEF
jgi:hypothetical protein